MSPTLLALVFLFGPPAKPTPTPHAVHIDFEKGADVTGKVHKPIGVAVEARNAEPFEEQIPERKDFKKELRKSLKLLDDSKP